MTAKRFLSQARYLDARIERKAEEAARLRARLTKATAQLTGMPRGGSGGDWTDADLAVMQLEEQIRDEIVELCRIKRQIAGAIDAVEDGRCRTLLELRYRNYYSFEQIAVEMHYSFDHVRHMHKLALQAVKVPDEVSTQ